MDFKIILVAAVIGLIAMGVGLLTAKKTKNDSVAPAFTMIAIILILGISFFKFGSPIIEFLESFGL